MIEHDKLDPTRLYIQLPGGWEAQTKGQGSSYRLYYAKTGERHMILCADDKRALEFVTKMFVEVHDEYGALRDKLVAAERERDALRDQLATVLAREAKTTARHDERVAALEVERDRLREALAPFDDAFALMVEGTEDYEANEPVTTACGRNETYVLRLGHFRHASAAMTPSGKISPAKADQDTGAIPSGKTEKTNG